MTKGRKTSQYETIDQIDLFNDYFEVVDYSEPSIIKKNKKGTFSQVAEALGSVIPSGSIVTLRNFRLNEDMERGDLAVLMSNGNVRKVEYSWFGNTFPHSETAALFTVAFPLNPIEDDNKFLNLYYQGGNYWLKVGEVKGSSIDYYSATFVNLPNILTLTPLTSSSFIMTYRDSLSNEGKVLLGTIQNNAIFINYDSIKVFATGSVADSVMRSGRLTNSTFFISYFKASQVFNFIGSVVDNEINSNVSTTHNIPNILNFYGFDAVSLSSSIIILYYAYRHTDTFRRHTGIAGEVSGSVISFGSPSTFDPVSGGTDNQFSSQSYVYKLTDSTFIVMYNSQDTTDDNKYGGWIRIGTVTGTSVSFASANSNNRFISGITSGGGGYPMRLSPLTESLIVCCYGKSLTSFYRKLMIITGTTVSYEDQERGNFSSTGFRSVIRINEDSYVVNFVDNNNNDVGSCFLGVGSLGSATQDKILGILQTGGSISEHKPVAIFSDVSTVHLGLTPGSFYCYDILNRNGVTLTNNGYTAGFALSSTDLKIVTY